MYLKSWYFDKGRCFGYVYNHIYYKDGYSLYTSAIVEVRNYPSRYYLEVITKSGSRYRLYYRYCCDVSKLESYGVSLLSINKIKRLAGLS